MFELMFDRFFFRSVEAQAVERGLKETRFEGEERIDLDELRRQIEAAIRQGNDGEMSDLARSRWPRSAARARLGRDRSRRTADPADPGPARAGPLRAPKPARGSTATPCGASSSSCGRSWSAA